MNAAMCCHDIRRAELFKLCSSGLTRAKIVSFKFASLFFYMANRFFYIPKAPVPRAKLSLVNDYCEDLQYTVGGDVGPHSWSNFYLQ